MLRSDSYDLNKNGWLEQSEIDQLKYIYVLTETLSELKGMEYLTSLTDLDIRKYSGTSIDLSECNQAAIISVTGCTATNLLKLPKINGDLQNFICVE